MGEAVGKWFMAKVAPFLDFALHEVVLRWRFVAGVVAVVAVTLVLAWLLLPILTNDLGLWTSLWGLPLGAWIFAALLLSFVVLDARGRWRNHLNGPPATDSSYPNRIVFAGFYEVEPRGRLYRGGLSRPLERRFLDVLRRELATHRLNTSGLRLGNGPLRVQVVNWHSPRGFAEAHDEVAFRSYLEGLPNAGVGAIWGTVAQDGRFATFEVVADEERFHGGPVYSDMMKRICGLAEVEGVGTPKLAELLAKVLVAFYGMGYCDPLGAEGRPLDTLPVVADSKRLVRAAVSELRAAGTREAEEASGRLEKLLMSQLIRQEARALRLAGRHRQAIHRLVESLEIDLFAPFADEAGFRLFLESAYNHSVSELGDDLRRFSSEQGDPEGGDTLDTNLADRFSQRALIGYPPPNIERLMVYLKDSHAEGLASDELTEGAFARLDARYPDNAYVHYYWGEARRLVSLAKHDPDAGPTYAAALDRAREKFERAHALEPSLWIALLRVAGLFAASAQGETDHEAIARRVQHGLEANARATRYLEENMPEWLADHDPRAVGRSSDPTAGAGPEDHGGPTLPDE